LVGDDEVGIGFEPVFVAVGFAASVFVGDTLLGLAGASLGDVDLAVVLVGVGLRGLLVFGGDLLRIVVLGTSVFGGVFMGDVLFAAFLAANFGEVGLAGESFGEVDLDGGVGLEVLAAGFGTDLVGRGGSAF
jgi:hypothetical protein